MLTMLCKMKVCKIKNVNKCVGLCNSHLHTLMPTTVLADQVCCCVKVAVTRKYLSSFSVT